jgi:hypothetical protein
MKLDQVRKFTLSLPDTTEEPHHHYGSFRVRGKIFVTLPPDQQHINVFVSEMDREAALAMEPEFIEKLFWGAKVAGLKLNLPRARASSVEVLIRKAYDFNAAKAPAKPKAKPKKKAPTASKIR